MISKSLIGLQIWSDKVKESRSQKKSKMVHHLDERILMRIEEYRWYINGIANKYIVKKEGKETGSGMRYGSQKSTDSNNREKCESVEKNKETIEMFKQRYQK